MNTLVEPEVADQGVVEGRERGPSKILPLNESRVKKNDSQAKGVSRPTLSADLAHTWLVWQCKMVAGLIHGALYLPEEIMHKTSPVSAWPLNGEDEPLLIDIASEALADKSGVVHSHQEYGLCNNRVCDLIACPLLVENEPVGVVALMISTRSESQQNAVLQLLQWGGLWMENLVDQQYTTKRDFGVFSLSLMTALVGCTSSEAAAIETVNRLADQFDCERVSIGYRKGMQIRLQALSHSVRFDPRTQLVRRIEAVMEEAVDQDRTISFPQHPDHGAAVTRAHSELVTHEGDGAICTIPIVGREGVIGAITLECKTGQTFDTETTVLCESLARFVGIELEQKLLEERSFLARSGDAFVKGVGSAFGFTRLKLALSLMLGMLLVFGLTLVEGTYMVTAPASIEGTVRHLLTAPQDGYVKQAQVRAGDLVKKGQLIALLDDRTLQLERHKWQSERSKIEKEYQEALANRERARLSVLRAQRDQVDAELLLVEEKIKRTQLQAPIDGVVVTGDLTQSLGTPVEIGQVLYEVAPLNNYRVVLEVDEQDMAGLNAGRSGKLIIAALPRTTFDLVIDQVAPVAVSSQTRNYFRVEASLANALSTADSILLLPGMQGVAKVDMGQRSLLWIWTHSLVERLRLWIWFVGW